MPADADSYTPAQKKAWLINKRNAIYTAIGVYCRANVGGEAWDSADAALNALTLQRQAA
jgi:hypothetical protein